MERHPRRTEALVISDTLARLLGGLRAATGNATAGELDVDHVRNVEAIVNCRLPDPVLALLAAQLSPLTEKLDLGLGEIPRHTRLANEAHVRGDLIAFGVESGAQVFHGFLIGAEDERISSYQMRGRRLSSLDIETWLEQHCELASAELASAEPFAPRLVRAVKTEPEGPRVRHAKWGVGRLLKEEGKGSQRKVKVAFPSVGLKVISARFVEFLDDSAT